MATRWRFPWFSRDIKAVDLQDSGDGRLMASDEVTFLDPHRFGVSGGRTIPAIRSAVSLLAHTMSTLPRSVVDADQRVNTVHPVTRLLNLSHRRWPATAVWEYLYRSALEHGIGYAWVPRFRGETERGRIYPCDPVMSSYRQTEDRTSYVFRLYPLATRARVDVSAVDTLVVVGDGYNGICGLSPVSAYAVTLGILGHSAEHLLSTLTKGMHISGVVESDPEVGQGLGWDLTRIAALRKKLISLFSGTSRAGGVPVLPPGFKFSAVPYNAVDIELVRLLELTIEDVCRIYRVPPRLIYHYRQGIRYSSDAESANSEFARYSVLPRAVSLGDMVGSQLLTDQARNEDGLNVHFSTDRLYAGTISQRIAAVDQGVARAGIMTVNEAREYVSTGRLPTLGSRDDGDRLLDPKGAPPQPRPGSSDSDRDDRE